MAQTVDKTKVVKMLNRFMNMTEETVKLNQPEEVMFHRMVEILNMDPSRLHPPIENAESCTDSEEENIFKEIQINTYQRPIMKAKRSFFICPYCMCRALHGAWHLTKKHMKVCEKGDGRYRYPIRVGGMANLLKYPRIEQSNFDTDDE